MRPIENNSNSDKSSLQSRNGLDKEEERKLCAWRHGPAALWYEMLGVNEDGTDLDYGFKLKEVYIVIFYIFSLLLSCFIPGRILASQPSFGRPVSI